MKNFNLLLFSLFAFIILQGQTTMAELQGTGFSHEVCKQTAKTKLKNSLKNWNNPSYIPKNAVLVVLGGGYSRECSAIDFYRRFKPMNIIATGRPAGVDRMVKIMVDGGVPENIIIREIESTNTRDHAYFVNRIIHNRYLIRPPTVLLTDRWHMLRANDYFAAYDFPPDYTWGSDPKYGYRCQTLGGGKTPTNIGLVDANSRIDGEARAYADVNLCDGLWPHLRNNRPYHTISRDLKLSTHEFANRCRGFINHTNQKNGVYRLDVQYCNDVTDSVVNNHRDYKNPIQCLTEAKKRNWNQSQTYNNCHDELLGSIFDIPKNYVNSLVSNQEVLNRFLNLSGGEMDRLSNWMSQLPNNEGSSGVLGYTPSNSEAVSFLNYAMSIIRVNTNFVPTQFVISN